MTRPDRSSLWLVAAVVLCCAAPVLVSLGLTAAVMGVVRQHWGWFAGGIGLATVAVVLRVRHGKRA